MSFSMDGVMNMLRQCCGHGQLHTFMLWGHVYDILWCHPFLGCHIIFLLFNKNVQLFHVKMLHRALSCRHPHLLF